VSEKKNKETKKLTANIERQLYIEFQHIAIDEDTSMTKITEKLIRQYVNKKRKK
jgi:hypothetical protein